MEKRNSVFPTSYLSALLLVALVTLSTQDTLPFEDTAHGLAENLARYGSGSIVVAGRLSSFLPPQTSHASPITPGGDIVVTSDPIGLPQNEPSISVNPLNPLNIVVAANDYRLALFTATAWVGYYTSVDGGQTWTSRLIPGFPFDEPVSPLADYDNAADPSVGFDLEGNGYIGGIVFNIVGNSVSDGTVFVARSDDGGVTFPFAQIVIRGAGPVFNDKSYLAVDRFPSSPFRGRVYISWTQFIPTGSRILISFSEDQGVSWSSPRVLSDSLLNQGSIPSVGPSGELYMTWLDLANNMIKFARSLDGGVSFSPAQVVYQITPLPDNLPNTLFRTHSLPSMAVDDVTGAIHIVWSDYGLGNSDVLLTTSPDGGTSWSRPLAVNDDETSNDQFFPWVVSSNETVSVAFYDRRLDPANHDIDVFLAHSRNSGLAFSDNLRITDGPFNPDLVFGGEFIGDYIGLALAPGKLHPVWADNRNVNSTAYLNQDVFTDAVKIGVFRDVAVTHLSLSRSFSYSSVPSNPILIEVGISNQGTSEENATVTVFLNSTSIASVPILNLSWSRPSANVTIELAAQGLSIGVYRLSAQIAIDGPENATANNTIFDGLLQIRLAGDVNADGIVNIIDLVMTGLTFLSTPESPRWNAAADINNDLLVDLTDLLIVGSNFLRLQA